MQDTGCDRGSLRLGLRRDLRALGSRAQLPGRIGQGSSSGAGALASLSPFLEADFRHLPWNITGRSGWETRGA